MAYEPFAGAGQGAITNSAQSSSTQGTRVTFTRSSIHYDSPFLDMTSMYIPRNIKSILRVIAAYVLGDGLVSQCITKMSEYPITRFIYNDDEDSKLKDDKTVDFWKTLLEKKVKIADVLKQCGMDYYAYGNSLISISYPFRRMLECPMCKEKYSADSLNYSFKDYKFFAKCRTKARFDTDGNKINGECRYNGEMKAYDQPTKEINKVKIVHWDLMHLNIKYNSITGDCFYYYNVPQDVSAAIIRGDRDILETTRLEVIEAIRKRKQLKLMSDNLYHMRRSAPQYIIPSQRGWGIPVVMPVLKDIFHCRILKKGNEMIAFDHIVPLRMLFPTGTGDVSPHLTTNLSTWRNKIEDEIRKWRRDPNRVSIVPIPVGMANFGGNGRVLMVTQELKATEDNIITGIGFVPEIVRGGASWSGSNVSLRVIENTFLNHRNDIQNVLEFIIERLSLYFDKAKIDVKMSDFKMADDLQKKRLMVDASKGTPSDAIVSRTTVTKELGFDPTEEYENRSNEIKKMIEMKIEEAEGTAEANGAGAVLNALYHADAQMESQKRMQAHEREMQSEHDEEIDQMKQNNAMGVEQEVSTISGNMPIQLPQLILILTQRFARLAQINKDEFKIRMLAMKNSTPSLYQEIFNNLKEMNLIEADLLPDLGTVQKYTPGQVPSNVQGETRAEEPPTPSEAASPEAPVTPESVNRIPEARPSVTEKSTLI